MDEGFACPECGSTVEVEGLAPGRQVRCGFCNRLLEVPYLPRAAGPQWKRRRFTRPRWFVWACATLAVASIIILGSWTFRFVTHQYDSAQQRSINLLLESSKANEADGRLDQSLIDLDTAIELARKAGPAYLARIDDWAGKRAGLARREAQAVIDRLNNSAPSSFPVGHWLTLIARAEKDPDLTPLAALIHDQFLAAANREIDSDLAAARRSAERGEALRSFNFCERIVGLADHIAPEKGAAVRTATESLVKQLIAKHGVIIEQPQGHFVFGVQSYVSQIVPSVTKAFESKGYLPYRPSAHWQNEWKQAKYHASIVVSEQLEGNYLSSANRLTRIEVRLTVRSTDQGAPVFQTSPTARSTVPLPNLPMYLSNRLAMSGERTEGLEKLLYDDARGKIDGKLAYSLSNMPECPASRPVKRP